MRSPRSRRIEGDRAVNGLRRRIRRLLIVVVAAIILPAVGLLAGLVINAASDQAHWPGWLELARLHPWQTFAVCTAVLLGLGTLVTALSKAEAAVGGTTSPAQPVRSFLPRDSAAFTARQPELEILARAASDLRSESPRVYAIDGMPGVGKTALAIHAGYLLSANFPDGQVFINLHAHTPGQQQMTPSAALAALLSAVGVPTEEIPTGLHEEAITDARSAMWRSLVSHRKLLLILDDAASHAQVEPLLPSEGRYLVLVTSRRRLAALDAVPLPIATLDRGEAVTLFRRLCRRPDEEVPADTAGELVELCGRLPLAISLVAGRLRHHSMWTIDDLVGRLRQEHGRLGEMRAENIAVAAAFELSYIHLPRDHQVVFQRLGLHPGTEIEARAAGALVGVPASEAALSLEALYDDHLLDQIAGGRYRMHDLLREYSRNVSASMCDRDRDEALRRLFGYYETVASAAAGKVARRVREATEPPAQDSVDSEQVATRPFALAWLVRERANIMACVDYAIQHGYYRSVIEISTVMASFLRQIGPWDETIQLQRKAVRAAQCIGERSSEANALTELGVVCRRMGDLDGAIKALEPALAAYVELGDGYSEANCLNELGVTRRAIGEVACAKAAHRQALLAFRDLHDGLGQARSLNYLGVAEALTGDLEMASGLLLEALALFCGGGDRHGEASVLNELGAVRRRCGDLAAALANQTRALDLFRDLGDRHGQANSLRELGVSLEDSGEYDRARQAYDEALEIFVSYGNQVGQCQVNNHVGRLLRRAGNPVAAREQQQLALAQAIAAGSLFERARALEELGQCALLLGDERVGVSDLRRAVEIYERVGAAEAAQLTTEYSELLSAVHDIAED